MLQPISAGQTSRNTDESEDLLATFERTQTIFEDDLARITRERGEVSY
jgi:hypothetical protein